MIKKLIFATILLTGIGASGYISETIKKADYSQSANSKEVIKEIQFRNYIKKSEREQDDNLRNISNRIDNEIIIYLESKGNPKEYNKREGARGLMQIRPIVLKEWNLLNPDKKHTLDDLYNSDINKKVGAWYLNRIETVYLPNLKLEQNLENKLASYNWGIGELSKIGDAKKNFSKLPLITQRYIKEYKRLSNKN